MITLKSLLEQLIEAESDAAQQAHELGLIAGGWGTWKDKNGQTVAKTIQGRLVKLNDATEDDDEMELNDFSQQLRDKYSVKNLELMYNPNTGDLRLDSLILDKSKQRQGTGTAIMQDLTSFADAHGKRLTLTPAEKNKEHGTTSTARLIRFYQRFGFVRNRGRHKDFRISDTMIREPKIRSK